MKWEQYFIISVELDKLSESLRHSLAHQIYNDELHVSPNLKLSSISAAAYIDRLDTASSFLEACSKVFEKRYGTSVELRVNAGGEKLSLTLSNRIQADSDLVRARLDQRCYAPNKRPIF